VDRRFLIGGGLILALFAVFTFFPKGKKEVVEATSGREVTAKQLYEEASHLKSRGDAVEAKLAYQKILTEAPDFGNIEQVQKDLESLNIQMIFSNVVTPNKTIIHEVQSGNTLGALAKQYGTTIELIKKSNGLASNIIRVGQKLRIWTGEFNIFVDKSQNVLILKDGNEILKVYTVSTGKNNSTPIGEFKVTTRLVDPVWFNKGIVVPPESPQNVLGSRWLGFDLPGYGIHGTVEPDTIGQQVTAGCVRMRAGDVEELFSLIPRGTKVVIVD